MQIDTRATLANVRQILKDYSSYKRLSNKIVQDEVVINAREYVKAVEDTIDSFDELHKFILENRYIKLVKGRDLAIHMGYKLSRYYDLQREALIMFAEAYPLTKLVVGA